MSRRVIAAVMAAVLAAVGTTALVLYVRTAEQRAIAGEETVGVLVVREEIPRGTRGEEIGDLVETEQVPAKVRAADGVDDLAAVKGRVASVDLMPGEQVVASRFVDPAQMQTGRITVPDGHQVVTVSLEPERTLGGQLMPGSEVGVIASFPGGVEGPATRLVLNEILVLNVQGEPAAQADSEEDRESAPGSNLLVSLAVEASDAETVVFAAEHGSIWLTYQPHGATAAGTDVRTLQGADQ